MRGIMKDVIQAVMQNTVLQNAAKDYLMMPDAFSGVPPPPVNTGLSYAYSFPRPAVAVGQAGSSDSTPPPPPPEEESDLCSITK